MTQPSTDFVQAYTGCQSRLYAFLLSLLGNAEQAKEVLQDTNLVIWQKSGEFEAGTNFMAWAFKIARYEVMAYRKRQSRDRLVFSEEAEECIFNAFTRHDASRGERQHLLQDCMKKLPAPAQDLLRRRYEVEQGLDVIAAETGKSYQAIGQALRRIRIALAQCIKRGEARLG